MSKRIVVWGTGVVGKMVIAEIVRHPKFELVGVGVSNPDKIGRDAGEICGIGLTGVKATDELETLISLRPDAVVHYGRARTREHTRDQRVLTCRHRCLLDRDDSVGVADDE